MASPQTEDGFTRIANELMEALIRAELGGVQTRIVLMIMRETYGFQRKTVQIGYQALSTRYGIPRTLLIREMTALVNRKVLAKYGGAGGRLGNSWGVQKDYALWCTSDSQVTSPPEMTSHSQVTSAPEVTSHQNGQRLVTPRRLVTSHSQETTSKKEKEKKERDNGVTTAATDEPLDRDAILAKYGLRWRGDDADRTH